MAATARKPKRHKQELDLTKNHPTTTYTDGSLGVHLPNDIPLYCRAFRLMGEIEDRDDKRKVAALDGWTVQLDAFTFGVKVYLRIGMDGTLKLFIEDADGRQKLVEWEKG